MLNTTLRRERNCTLHIPAQPEKLIRAHCFKSKAISYDHGDWQVLTPCGNHRLLRQDRHATGKTYFYIWYGGVEIMVTMEGKPNHDIQ